MFLMKNIMTYYERHGVVKIRFHACCTGTAAVLNPLYAHLLTCRSMKGAATYSYLSSISGGNSALTRAAMVFPARRRQDIGMRIDR